MSQQNEIESLRYELQKKNNLIYDLRKNLRNQMFLTEDKDYVIMDLENDVNSLKKQNLDLIDKLSKLSDEYNKLRSEKKELLLLNFDLNRENINITKNVNNSIEEFKEIMKDFCCFKSQFLKDDLKSNIMRMMINDYL